MMGATTVAVAKVEEVRAPGWLVLPSVCTSIGVELGDTPTLEKGGLKFWGMSAAKSANVALRYLMA